MKFIYLSRKIKKQVYGIRAVKFATYTRIFKQGFSYNIRMKRFMFRSNLKVMLHVTIRNDEF